MIQEIKYAFEHKPGAKSCCYNRIDVVIRSNSLLDNIKCFLSRAVNSLLKIKPGIYLLITIGFSLPVQEIALQFAPYPGGILSHDNFDKRHYMGRIKKMRYQYFIRSFGIGEFINV